MGTIGFIAFGLSPQPDSPLALELVGAEETSGATITSARNNKTIDPSHNIVFMEFSLTGEG
jgi:hypothetical protein